MLVGTNSENMCKQTILLYSLVVSVLDEIGNRIDAHEVYSSNNKDDVIRDKAILEQEIETGRHSHLGNRLCADIEVHNDETYELLEII